MKLDSRARLLAWDEHGDRMGRSKSLLCLTSCWSDSACQHLVGACTFGGTYRVGVVPTRPRKGRLAMKKRSIAALGAAATVALVLGVGVTPAMADTAYPGAAYCTAQNATTKSWSQNGWSDHTVEHRAQGYAGYYYATWRAVTVVRRSHPPATRLGRRCDAVQFRAHEES